MLNIHQFQLHINIFCLFPPHSRFNSCRYFIIIHLHRTLCSFFFFGFSFRFSCGNRTNCHLTLFDHLNSALYVILCVISPVCFFFNFSLGFSAKFLSLLLLYRVGLILTAFIHRFPSLFHSHSFSCKQRIFIKYLQRYLWHRSNDEVLEFYCTEKNLNTI